MILFRVMQKYNLLSVVRRKKHRNYGEYLHRYPNLLNRDFQADRPNQKWVTDISYIKTGQGILYLSVIRDLYDNSIVAYKTGTEQNINLVLSTIRAAKGKEKVTAELQLHSAKAFSTPRKRIICPSYTAKGSVRRDRIDGGQLHHPRRMARTMAGGIQKAHLAPEHLRGV